jgi:AcrR family transcriptional regulator
MSELQRTRIVAAAAEILQEITVARIVTRARVSRKTFYEHFEDREGCFIAALEDLAAGGVGYSELANPISGRELT